MLRISLKLLITYIITCCLIALACAQLPTTHAGPGSPGGGGGGGTCTGTALHLTSPNDLTNAAWTAGNLNAFFNATDPNGVANNASNLVVASTSAGGASIRQSTGIMFTTSTTYAFTAYLKPNVGSTWITFSISDFVANSWGSWFNLSGSGVVGGASAGGTGHLTCANIITSTNGYYIVSIGGNFSSSPQGANPLVVIDPVDGNNLGGTTLNQQIIAWQVSP